MKKNLFYLLAILFFVASCQSKSSDPQEADNEEVAEEVQVSNEPETNPFPWDFPMHVDSEFEVGQFVLSPYTFYPSHLKKGKDLLKESLIFYSTKMDSIGEVYSKVDRKVVMPNSLIIPIPVGQTAKKGDILLTWWQSGSGMQRAIVTEAKNPETPSVNFLDLSYSDDPARPSMANKHENEMLKSNSFVKLIDGEWNSGMPIAIRTGAEWIPAVLIHATNDKVIARASMGNVTSAPKDNCILLPLYPDFKEGDIVNVVFVSKFKDGYEVVKYDKNIGRVWVKQSGRNDVKVVSIYEVAKL